jgi:hypothetical protein
MKMLEVQFVELKEKIIAAEVAKGFSEAAAGTALKDAGVFKGETIEERLSNLKKHAKKVGLTESGRPARVKRNNGAFVEGSDEGRVERAMRVHKMTIREASIFCGLGDPGPRAKPPANFNEGLRDRWKKHMGGLISESDLDQLVERQIEPK